jgi:hypothetical protein
MLFITASERQEFNQKVKELYDKIHKTLLKEIKETNGNTPHTHGLEDSILLNHHLTKLTCRSKAIC